MFGPELQRQYRQLSDGVTWGLRSTLLRSSRRDDNASSHEALGAYAVWGPVAQAHTNTVGIAVMALFLLPAVWLLLFSGRTQPRG